MKKLVLIAGLIALVVIIIRNSEPVALFNAAGDVVGGPATAIRDMPKFSLVKISGGNLKSEELQGKVLVVDFWASWCEPCKSEVPKYNKLAASMAGKDFQMIGYAVDSGTLDEVRKSAEELGIHYQVVMGTDAVAEGFGNYRALPTTFLVGRDGKIYKKYEGTSGNKMNDLARDVAQLLDVTKAPPADPVPNPTTQLSR